MLLGHIGVYPYAVLCAIVSVVTKIKKYPTGQLFNYSTQ